MNQYLQVYPIFGILIPTAGPCTYEEDLEDVGRNADLYIFSQGVFGERRMVSSQTYAAQCPLYPV